MVLLCSSVQGEDSLEYIDGKCCVFTKGPQCDAYKPPTLALTNHCYGVLFIDLSHFSNMNFHRFSIMVFECSAFGCWGWCCCVLVCKGKIVLSILMASVVCLHFGRRG